MFTIQCPHCNDPIVISKLNCGIFRHGLNMRTKKQMDPHMLQSVCDKLIKKKKIYGCGGQFKILHDDTCVVIKM